MKLVRKLGRFFLGGEAGGEAGKKAEDGGEVGGDSLTEMSSSSKSRLF